MDKNTYTREQYMAGEVTHDQYYGQFVTGSLLTLVEKMRPHILASTCQHFNDVHLTRWDGIAAFVPPDVRNLIVAANGGGISLSDKVCALKAAARVLKTTHEEKYANRQAQAQG